MFGEKQGKRSKRINLIMAQKGKKWLSPFLFTGSCTAQLFEEWMEKQLFKTLKTPSLIVMDNAPFHRKKQLNLIAKKNHHKLLFLPPYSPDFNPIEKSFGWLKRKRLYDKEKTTLESLIVFHC